MSFTQAELDYLASQPLAGLATVGPDGQPDVVPVAVEFDGTGSCICGAGEAVLHIRKALNVLAGRAAVALGVDNLISIEPFVAPGIRCTA